MLNKSKTSVNESSMGSKKKQKSRKLSTGKSKVSASAMNSDLNVDESIATPLLEIEN